MTPLYQATVKQIGDCAFEALEDNMMIIFGDMAPADAAEYCFVHSHDTLRGEITTTGALQLGQHQFRITAVGEVVNKNLAELGHITIRFDGLTAAEYPGCLHVDGPTPTDLKLGDMISFS